MADQGMVLSGVVERTVLNILSHLRFDQLNSVQVAATGGSLTSVTTVSTVTAVTTVGTVAAMSQSSYQQHLGDMQYNATFRANLVKS